MTDNSKSCLAMFFLLCAFLMPCLGFVLGWIGWDIQVGAMIALGSFALFFVLSGVILATVKDPSWFVVSLPLIAGAIYSLLPDFFIGPLDDAAAFAGGAILTFALAIRKFPETPKWIVFPMLVAGLYTVVGSLIPGPVDELLVYGATAGYTGFQIRKQLQENSDVEKLPAPSTEAVEQEQPSAPEVEVDGQ